MITWTNDTRKLSDLVPWERNPKRLTKKQAEGLRLSIERFGFAVPLLISPDGDIYDGHQRQAMMNAIKEYGPDAVVDVRVSSRPLTDDERRELVVRLKQNQAGWDFEMLPNLYEREELLDWGFEPEELGMFQEELAGEDPGAQINKAAELREKWGVESGQLWALGEHRLICGDCTDAAVVARVMGDAVGDLWLTDPPYAVSYADKNAYLNSIAPGNRIQVPIVNDHLSLEDAADLWQRAAVLALEFCADHASYYWFACQGGDQMMMMMRLSEAGWRVRHELIWVKNNHVLGRTDYNYKHEPILYGWKKDGKHKFFGGFQTSVLEFPKPQSSGMHPTTKPVELVERLVGNSSQTGQVVYDGFLGSGTTVIACERLGRRCRACEIEPGYVAVCLERWSVMTGQTPVLLENNSNGKQQSSP